MAKFELNIAATANSEETVFESSVVCTIIFYTFPNQHQFLFPRHVFILNSDSIRLVCELVMI